MNDLQTFFTKLAAWEGKPVAALAAPWNRSDPRAIASDFRRAFGRSGITACPLSLPASVTNQSTGNRVAEFVASQIGPELRHFRIEPLVGPGYPDKRLRRIRGGRAFAMELKATGRFNPRSSNRIVLLSASAKLRREFRGPVSHLLVTICYRRRRGQLWVQAARLEFLMPTTRVNVRLEASVSRRLLSQDPGAFFWIGKLDREIPSGRRRTSALAAGRRRRNSAATI